MPDSITISDSDSDSDAAPSPAQPRSTAGSGASSSRHGVSRSPSAEVFDLTGSSPPPMDFTPQGVLWQGPGLSGSKGKGKDSPKVKAPLLMDKLDEEVPKSPKPKKEKKKTKKQQDKEDAMDSDEREDYFREQEAKAKRRKEAEFKKATSGKIAPSFKKSLNDKQAGTFATQTLKFPSSKPATMDFAKGKVRPTKGQIKKKGRKKGKGKGKRSRSSDDESDDEATDGEQDEEDVIKDDVPRYSLNDIAGGPETLPDSIFRGIILSPSLQLPWAWQRLSHPKPYSGTNAIPLLLVHRDPLPHVKGWETLGSVLTHVPETEEGNAKLNAKMWLTFRHDKAKRRFLRLAICSGAADSNSWNRLENVAFVQDFPEQTSSNGKALPSGYDAVFDNDTHTDFSRQLVEFLFKTLGVPTTAEYKTFVEPFSSIDWRGSEKIRLVYSAAGKHETNQEIETAGGLVSLAKAIRELKTFSGGSWEVEYACCKSVPLSKEFLCLHFWRAIQGIDPRDSTTPADKFKRSKVRIIYPEQSWAEAAKDKNVLIKDATLVSWTQPKDGKEDEDQRPALLHHHDAKSKRLSTAEMITIIHHPADPQARPEAFVVVGSHSFSTGAWGLYRPNSLILRTFELGVVTRESAADLETLEILLHLRTGYTRPAEKYDSDEEPFQDMPEPLPTVKRTKKGE